VTIKPKVVDDLDVWSQELLRRTVWAGNCRSWYKNGTVDGNITALHAGSAMHYRGQSTLLQVPVTLGSSCINHDTEMLEKIRGEDFDIAYNSSNKFRYLGNGFTLKDANGEDLAFYLK
jgi:hypothetical protein